jgi:hypothetical protein
MTFPRPAQRGEGQGEGIFLSANPMPPLPYPLLHECVEEREKTKVPKKCQAPNPRFHRRSDAHGLLPFRGTNPAALKRTDDVVEVRSG